MSESRGLELFHGTRRNLPLGTVLEARRPEPDAEEAAVEEILERRRPEGCIPRSESVFMSATADTDDIEKKGGYADFVFRVRPEGPVERNDVGWWGEIYSGGSFEVSEGDMTHLSELYKMADAYWRGDASSNRSWEYRARKATVIECVGGYEVPPAPTSPP